MILWMYQCESGVVVESPLKGRGRQAIPAYLLKIESTRLVDE
jgi:hypothetical protein